MPIVNNLPRQFRCFWKLENLVCSDSGETLFLLRMLIMNNPHLPFPPQTFLARSVSGPVLSALYPVTFCAKPPQAKLAPQTYLTEWYLTFLGNLSYGFKLSLHLVNQHSQPMVILIVTNNQARMGRHQQKQKLVCLTVLAPAVLLILGKQLNFFSGSVFQLENANNNSSYLRVKWMTP